MLSGEWIDRIIGLENVRVEVVMARAPNGTDMFEVVGFHSPSAGAQELAPAANRPGLRHVAFKVDNVRGVVDRGRGRAIRPRRSRPIAAAQGLSSVLGVVPCDDSPVGVPKRDQPPRLHETSVPVGPVASAGEIPGAHHASNRGPMRCACLSAGRDDVAELSS
jgi:hypothetical protein